MAKYKSLRDSIINFFNSKGYIFTLYDGDGNKVDNPYRARYVFIELPNMMLIINEGDNTLELHRGNFDFKLFRDILKTLRSITRKYFIHLNVATYNKTVQPKQFYRDILINKERNVNRDLVESKKPLDNMQKHAKVGDMIVENYLRGKCSEKAMEDLFFLLENSESYDTISELVGKLSLL